MLPTGQAAPVQWDFFQELYTELSAVGMKVHRKVYQPDCRMQKTLEVQVFASHLQTWLQQLLIPPDVIILPLTLRGIPCGLWSFSMTMG